MALGMLLRAYRFDKYRTKKDEAENGDEAGERQGDDRHRSRDRREEGLRRRARPLPTA